MKAATADQMRAIDKKTVEQIGIPSLVLMENAGRAVFQATKNLLHNLTTKKVLIFAGKGNNGGDGFVAARHLHNNQAEVHVFLLGKTQELKNNAQTNCQIAQNMGLKITQLTTPAKLKLITAEITSADLIIDAIFGTGFQGEVRGLARDIINTINQSQKPIIAIDIPSGLHANTGKIGGVCVKATKTVTLGLPKIGLLIYPGASYAGDLEIADISIPKEILQPEDIKINLITPAQVKYLLPTQRPPQAHKGDFGRLLILSGSPGMTGAATLTSQGALQIGAGLVTLGIPESLNPILEAKLTEVMTQPLPETTAQTLSPNALPQIKQALNKADVLAIGPGISLNPPTAQLIKQLIPQITIPTVIDADAITILAQDTHIFKSAKAPIMLTPHPGELARLLKTSIPEIQANRIDAAQKAATEFSTVIVLKGARTIIAHPTGVTYINPTGNPGMASGGVGDVLTGMLAGLAAQKLPLLDAAVCAVYLHGLAGDLAAQTKGQLPLIASDILTELHKAIKKVEATS